MTRAKHSSAKKAGARRPDTRSRDITTKRAYALLLLILIFGAALAASVYKGMSYYGNDFAYESFTPSILQGTFLEDANIFSIRLMLLYPLAFFVYIFGYTNLAAGAYSYVCYLGLIVLTYLIGKEVYNSRAGLLGALLFSFYPIALKYSSDAISMVPLAFWLALAMLFFVYAKKSNKATYYLLSGVFTFAAALINPLAFIYALFFVFYIVVTSLIDVYRKRSLRINYIPFLYLLGIFTAIIIMGFINLGLASSHQPFYEFSLTGSYYSAAGKPDTIYYTNSDIWFYFNDYFPYHAYMVPYYLLTLNLSGASDYASSIYLQLFNFDFINLNDVGFFSYFVVAFGLYLLISRDRRAYFVLLWAAFVMGYLEFGTMSFNITHYFPIYRLMKFSIIVAVPLMLIIGIGLARLYERSFRNKRVIWLGIVGVMVVFLLGTTITMDYYYYLANHNTVLFDKVIAEYLMKVPDLSQANVYGSALTIFYSQYFMGYAPTRSFQQYSNGDIYGGIYVPSCSDIPNNTYLIIPTVQNISVINSFDLWSINEKWAFDPSLCGLTLYADVYNNTTVKGLNPIWGAYTGNIYYKN
ncbi:MAG: glycosyltransferase family 39 protein [Candidatus Micrarchaeaceae archaeon]